MKQAMHARRHDPRDRGPIVTVSRDRFTAPEDRARWLLDFVRADLAALTFDELAALRSDALEFLYVGEGDVIDITPDLDPADHLPTSAVLRQVQADFRAG